MVHRHMHDHPACLSEEALLTNCRIWRGRRSGPGGQHRNKVETAIVIEHLPSGVRAEATERRSQVANLRVAIQRLRTRLAVTVRQPVADNPPLAPSTLWQDRLAGQRILIGSNHIDFPALLAEALDTVFDRDDDLTAAAAFLRTSPSQLLKFLKREPAAVSALNDRRRNRDEHPLK